MSSLLALLLVYFIVDKVFCEKDENITLPTAGCGDFDQFHDFPWVFITGVSNESCTTKLGYDFTEYNNPADALNIACYETRREISIFTAVKLERITAIVGHSKGYGGLLAYRFEPGTGKFIGDSGTCDSVSNYTDTFSLKLAKIYDMSATYGGSLYVSATEDNFSITFTLEMGTILESTAEYFGGGSSLTEANENHGYMDMTYILMAVK
jgi:hypothetical protein